MEDNHSAKVANLFDEWAGNQRGENMALGHDELVHHIYDSWNFSEHEKLLDVACGNGRALWLSKNYGVRNHAGIDISSKMIERAKQVLPDADLSVGSAFPLPWESSFFNKIISVEAAYYFENPQDVFKEFKRVLHPNGKIAIVIEYYKENIGSHAWQSQLPVKLNLLSENEWIELLKIAGFDDIQKERIVRNKNLEGFSTSPYFPSIELYKEYVRQGALKLFN